MNIARSCRAGCAVRSGSRSGWEGTHVKGVRVTVDDMLCVLAIRVSIALPVTRGFLENNARFVCWIAL